MTLAAVVAYDGLGPSVYPGDDNLTEEGGRMASCYATSNGDTSSFSRRRLAQRSPSHWRSPDAAASSSLRRPVQIARSVARSVLSRASGSRTAMPVLWALGWTATTLGGIHVDEQFTVFGLYGALTFSALSGLVLHRLLHYRMPSSPRVAGTPPGRLVK
jgi:hypothetical protein